MPGLGNRLHVTGRPANHSGGHGVVAQWIDEDEAAGTVIYPITVEEQRPGGLDGHASNFIEVEMVGGLPMQGVHINLVLNP